MAAQDIGAVFYNQVTQMANVTSSVCAQGIARVVKSFNVDSKEFKAWKKPIECIISIESMPS